jgi:hypothetical protein
VWGSPTQLYTISVFTGPVRVHIGYRVVPADYLTTLAVVDRIFGPMLRSGIPCEIEPVSAMTDEPQDPKVVSFEEHQRQQGKKCILAMMTPAFDALSRLSELRKPEMQTLAVCFGLADDDYNPKVMVHLIGASTEMDEPAFKLHWSGTVSHLKPSLPLWPCEELSKLPFWMHQHR